MGEKRGRPAKPQADEQRASVLWQRLIENAHAVGLDPRITSQIGRLRIMRLLTDAQAAAADLIGRIYGRYERLHGVNRSCRSPSYEFSTAGARDRTEDPDWIEQTERDYAAVQACIPTFPRDVRDAIEALCAEDRAIPAHQVNLIYPVLNRVSVDFGLGPATDDVVTPLARTRSKPRRTRQERVDRGEFAARTDDAKPGKPSELTGEAAQSAARDRAGLVRMLERRAAAQEVT